MKWNSKVKVINKRILQDDVYQLIVERPQSMNEIKPGQFYNIVASKWGTPLLRRPISVSGYDDEKIEFTIKTLGSGTLALMETQVGDLIDIMGPLGNGFEMNVYPRILMIGGGIGIAPIKGLLKNWPFEATEIHSILGYRDVPYLENEFVENCINTTIVSERDLNHETGYVTKPLLRYFDDKDEASFDMVYACGPHAMLKSVSDLCNLYNVPVQLLMEEKMACGIGACLVCTCKIKDGDFGYKHSRMCKDGPMFYGSEVIFDE